MARDQAAGGDPDPMIPDLDTRVRLAAFEFLAEQTQLQGEVLPRDRLAAGFMFKGSRVPLIGPQGIFKPAVLPEMPLPGYATATARVWTTSGRPARRCVCALACFEASWIT
jgi:hypothetical protein